MDSLEESNELFNNCILRTIQALKEMSPEEQLKGGKLKQLWDTWNKDNAVMVDPETPYLKSTNYKRAVATLYREVIKSKGEVSA